MKWVKTRVNVHMVGREYLTVDTEAYGPLCVHRPIVAEGCKPRGWVVTHIATGLRAGVVTEKKADAKWIAEHLVNNYGPVFSLKTDKEVCAAVPREVVAWLRACCAQMKYIAPVPA